MSRPILPNNEPMCPDQHKLLCEPGEYSTYTHMRDYAYAANQGPGNGKQKKGVSKNMVAPLSARGIRTEDDPGFNSPVQYTTLKPLH